MGPDNQSFNIMYGLKQVEIIQNKNPHIFLTADNLTLNGSRCTHVILVKIDLCCVSIGKKEQKLTFNSTLLCLLKCFLHTHRQSLRSREDENKNKHHVWTNEWKTAVYLVLVKLQVSLPGGFHQKYLLLGIVHCHHLIDYLKIRRGKKINTGCYFTYQFIFGIQNCKLQIHNKKTKCLLCIWNLGIISVHNGLKQLYLESQINKSTDFAPVDCYILSVICACQWFGCLLSIINKLLSQTIDHI